MRTRLVQPPPDMGRPPFVCCVGTPLVLTLDDGAEVVVRASSVPCWHTELKEWLVIVGGSLIPMNRLSPVAEGDPS